VAALRAHKELFGNSEYVFTRDDGKQFDSDGLRWRFGKIMRVIGLDHTDPYVMRHTFASICYDKGVTVKPIIKMMGHANEAITLRVYAHRFNPDVADTGDVVDDIWGDE
jgi:integrase